MPIAARVIEQLVACRPLPMRKIIGQAIRCRWYKPNLPWHLAHLFIFIVLFLQCRPFGTHQASVFPHREPLAGVTRFSET